MAIRAVSVLEPVPAPAGGDAQHRVGQRAEVIGHLLHAQTALYVARQYPKDFCMVRPAQQVEQSFVVIFSASNQCAASVFQFPLKVLRVKALLKHRIAGQFVNHARVLEQITCGPARSTQHMQQPFMHIGSLQQQRQIALAPQQWLYPVSQAYRGHLGDLALRNPLRGAHHQSRQPGAGVFTQRQHPGVVAPARHAVAKLSAQLRQQFIKVAGAQRWRRCTATPAFLVSTAQQRVKFLRHEFAVAIEFVQQGAAVGQVHGQGNPIQIRVRSWQDVGLLVIQVLDAVFHLAQKNISAGQGVRRVLRHQAGVHQSLQCTQGWPGTQLGVLTPAHHLQQLHRKFNLANAPARQFDVVAALGFARAAFGGVVSNLAVQYPQRVEHVVVQVSSKHKRRHYPTQTLCAG